MAKRVIIALILVLAVAAVPTAIKHFVFNVKLKPYRPDSWTAAEAKQNGTWLCDVTVEPNQLKGVRQDLEISEAWIEAGVEDDFYFVWFPYKRRLDFNVLCFRINGEKQGTYGFEWGGRDIFSSSTAGDKNQRWAKFPIGDLSQKPITIRFRDWEIKTYVEIGLIRLIPKTEK